IVPMTTKEQLHHLVDQLPEREVPTAQRVLEALRDTSDPVARLPVSQRLTDLTYYCFRIVPVDCQRRSEGIAILAV
ncbi:MAG: hypothetical protein AAB281_04655, partial [Actinomycetota bacterium]